MYEGRRDSVLSWLHEVDPRPAVRQRQFVQVTRCGRRSLGFADPAAGVGYAYVMNRMGTPLTEDPRDVVLRDALYSSIGVPSGALGQRVA
jgi:hypothetical protein